MSEKEKKYYWLKLPRDFFGKHYIKILLAKENEEYGKEYGKMLMLFYVWMLTESIDHEGKLRYSETKPYNEGLLADTSHFPLQLVTEALHIFTDLELVVTESDGTLFLPKSLKMIGSESGSAQRVRDYRNRKKEEQQTSESAENTEKPKNCYTETSGNKTKQKCNTEKELEKEIDKDNIKDIVGQAPTPPPYKVIIDYLNQKTNSHYQSTTKSTQTKINARIKEGATIEDFMLVIDLKSSQWMGDKKMEAYLRPETLFAASHFESYLNEAKRSAAAKPKHSGISQRLAAEVSVDVDESSDFD